MGYDEFIVRIDEMTHEDHMKAIELIGTDALRHRLRDLVVGGLELGHVDALARGQVRDEQCRTRHERPHAGDHVPRPCRSGDSRRL